MSEFDRGRRVAVLVLACASEPYGRLIDAIRGTWGSRKVADTDVYYVYGNPEEGRRSEELARHVEGDLPRVEDGGMVQVGDVLIAGCADSIQVQEDCLLRKRLIAFGHLCEGGDYDLVYTVCASSYVDLDKLRTVLDSIPAELAAAGPVSLGATSTVPLRQVPFVSGATMLLTADVALALARNREEVIAQNEFGFRDDVAIGQWIANNLSAVAIEQIVEDLKKGGPLTREHVFFRVPKSSMDFVRVPAEEQRPSATAYHYHFHSRRADDMERFDALLFPQPDRESLEGSAGTSVASARVHRGKIRYVQIFGERCSGTFYLARLIEKNFKGVESTSAFGFKHWFVKDHEPRGRPNRSTDFQCLRRLDDSEDTLFVVIHRNPFDWLRSIRDKPYHSPGHWALSFSEFIRKPWLCLERERVNALWPEGEADYFIEEAENILRLRSQKIEHFLNLEGIVSNVVFLKYEELLADLNVLEAVADRFGIELQDRPLQDEERYFGGGKQKTFVAPKVYPPISPEDLGFIRRNLDWGLEARLGYDLAASGDDSAGVDCQGG